MDDYQSFRALAPCTDGMFVGGSFDTIADVEVTNLAWYDGTDWRSVVDGEIGVVSHFAFGDREIFMAGTHPSPMSWSNLASWRY